MMIIPLQAVPNQTLAVTLALQNVQIALRQNGANIYLDLLVNSAYVVRTRICRDRQRLLLDAQYRGFIGELSFIDTQGLSDPIYTGLGAEGARFLLLYLEAGE